MTQSNGPLGVVHPTAAADWKRARRLIELPSGQAVEIRQITQQELIRMQGKILLALGGPSEEDRKRLRNQLGAYADRLFKSSESVDEDALLDYADRMAVHVVCLSATSPRFVATEAEASAEKNAVWVRDLGTDLDMLYIEILYFSGLAVRPEVRDPLQSFRAESTGPAGEPGSPALGNDPQPISESPAGGGGSGPGDVPVAGLLRDGPAAGGNGPGGAGPGAGQLAPAGETKTDRAGDPDPSESGGTSHRTF